MIYSGWLACRSRLTAPHLPERVVRQFGYTQTILRHPTFSALPAFTHRQIKDMFDDYKSHLVPEEARTTIAENDRSYVERYIKWFFKLSHLYMVHAAPRDPSRQAHQKILEDEHAQLDYAEDVLPRCHRIIKIAQTDINTCIFPDGSYVRRILDAIMTEARGTLLYRRHHRSTKGIDGRGGRRGRGGKGEVVRHTQ